MICQNCHKREANVHMSTTINGHTEEQHLCNECAEKAGLLKESFALSNLFPSERFSRMFSPAKWFTGSLFGLPFGISSGGRLTDSFCETCDTTLNEFAETGLLGCPECYDIYRDEVSDAVERLQGTNRHLSIKGRDEIDGADVLETDARKDEEVGDKAESRRQELERLLRQALAEEDYLECAKLRDEIRKLEEE